MFYPSDPAKLRAEVMRYTPMAPDLVCPQILGLVSPHAGYAYSGAIAGAAWAHLRGTTPDLVVLLGPSHRVFFTGFALPESKSWKTPLGTLVVDAQAARLMEDAPCIVWEEPHLDEHSIEVQLPFLQTILERDVPILPIVCGRCSRAEIEALALALVGLYHQRKGRVLFVASTDLSHDHPYDEAREMDGRVAAALAALDDAGLANLFATQRAEACGMVGLEVLVRLAGLLGQSRAEITALANSGDMVGDKDSRIVGYCSAIICREAQDE
jgi:AmmeMemoRadiSam system protein B